MRAQMPSHERGNGAGPSSDTGVIGCGDAVAARAPQPPQPFPARQSDGSVPAPPAIEAALATTVTAGSVINMLERALASAREQARQPPVDREAALVGAVEELSAIMRESAREARVRDHSVGDQHLGAVHHELAALRGQVEALRRELAEATCAVQY
jgi:hypothetical protein